MAHVAGFCLLNDECEGGYHVAGGGGRMMGNSVETFGPLGSWLATPFEIDPSTLTMSLDVNRMRKQNGSTATMIFGAETLLSYISRFMVPDPGEVSAAWTPPGVGLARKPPEFLKPGDELTLRIEGGGEMRGRIALFGP